MSTSPSLSGPSVIPAGASHALICLHGFGSSGDDLATLAPPLQSALGKLGATTAVFAPHAPFPCEINEEGYQWFANKGWSFRDEPGLKHAAQALDSYLTFITKTHAIPRTKMSILGFSQGAMITLYALPNLSEAPAAVIALSGGLTVEPEVPETTPTTPIFFSHGLADDVWPTDYTVNAEAFYSRHGYPTRLELIEDLGHGIDAITLAHITLFLNEVWQTAD